MVLSSHKFILEYIDSVLDETKVYFYIENKYLYLIVQAAFPKPYPLLFMTSPSPLYIIFLKYYFLLKSYHLGLYCFYFKNSTKFQFLNFDFLFSIFYFYFKL